MTIRDVTFLIVLMTLVSYIFYAAAASTDKACRAKGMQAYEMRGYFCVDTEGRLYVP